MMVLTLGMWMGALQVCATAARTMNPAQGRVNSGYAW